MQGGLSDGATAYEAAVTTTGGSRPSGANGGANNAIAGAIDASAFSREDVLVGLTAVNTAVLLVWLIAEVSG